ncbi:flagellar motor protein MotB [Roseiconus lacunae]|uniref:flagellar motor protein MotB n=1 Tax=Roseiconus lacunae TaxID=2605694 RepID=UPI0011F10FBD|nr:flagellar motor protein MotB [Roseiconus lacunae]
MSKRKKLEPSVPSKAYLVSFGDTMTALLAFFIVLNSLAKEQTGANMYSGTGSFVNAFTSAGTPGKMSGDRSSEMIQQESQKPLYALQENLHKNEKQEDVGPDESNNHERVIDRDREQFQKFLKELEEQLDLRTLPQIEDQVVFDSFQPPDPKTGKISRHATQLISETLSKMRDENMVMEIVVWADMPKASALKRTLEKSTKLRNEVESSFWMNQSTRSRIKYRVKPWLFADAKRPQMSIILGRQASPAAP